MTENSLKNRLALFMLVSHLVLILFIVFLRLIKYFDDDILKVSLPIIVPLFASYSTIGLKSILENRNRMVDQSEKINSTAAFASFFVPVLFVVLVYAIVVKQALDATSPESFAVLLGIGESAFAVYMGYIFKSLFHEYPVQKKEKSR